MGLKHWAPSCKVISIDEGPGIILARTKPQIQTHIQIDGQYLPYGRYVVESKIVYCKPGPSRYRPLTRADVT